MMTENKRTASQQEIEKKQVAGIGLAIVMIDPSRNGDNISNPVLWTNRELKAKKYTERVIGQITIPSDTRKKGERGFSNVLGTLAEFSADDELIKSLHFVRGSSYFRSKIWIRDNPFDFAVLIIDRPITDVITPVDVNEVMPNGWMSLEELRSKDSSEVRSFIGQVIGGVTSRSVISDVVDNYLKFPEKRIPLSKFLPQNFSIAEFFNKREKLADMIGNSGVIYESKRQ